MEQAKSAVIETNMTVLSYEVGVLPCIALMFLKIQTAFTLDTFRKLSISVLLYVIGWQDWYTAIIVLFILDGICGTWNAIDKGTFSLTFLRRRTIAKFLAYVFCISAAYQIGHLQELSFHVIKSHLPNIQDLVGIFIAIVEFGSVLRNLREIGFKVPNVQDIASMPSRLKSGDFKLFDKAYNNTKGILSDKYTPVVTSMRVAIEKLSEFAVTGNKISNGEYNNLFRIVEDAIDCCGLTSDEANLIRVSGKVVEAEFKERVYKIINSDSISNRGKGEAIKHIGRVYIQQRIEALLETLHN